MLILWLGMSTLLVAAALTTHYAPGVASGAGALVVAITGGGLVVSEFMGLRRMEASTRLLFSSAFVMMYFLLGLTLFDVFLR